jgi:hypothetical protein
MIRAFGAPRRKGAAALAQATKVEMSKRQPTSLRDAGNHANQIQAGALFILPHKNGVALIKMKKRLCHWLNRAVSSMRACGSFAKNSCRF